MSSIDIISKLKESTPVKGRIWIDNRIKQDRNEFYESLRPLATMVEIREEMWRLFLEKQNKEKSITTKELEQEEKKASEGNSEKPKEFHGVKMSMIKAKLDYIDKSMSDKARKKFFKEMDARSDEWSGLKKKKKSSDDDDEPKKDPEEIREETWKRYHAHRTGKTREIRELCALIQSEELKTVDEEYTCSKEDQEQGIKKLKGFLDELIKERESIKEEDAEEVAKARAIFFQRFEAAAKPWAEETTPEQKWQRNQERRRQDDVRGDESYFRTLAQELGRNSW